LNDFNSLLRVLITTIFYDLRKYINIILTAGRIMCVFSYMSSKSEFPSLFEPRILGGLVGLTLGGLDGRFGGFRDTGTGWLGEFRPELSDDESSPSLTLSCWARRDLLISAEAWTEEIIIIIIREIL
jgi:hypothetical protein